MMMNLARFWRRRAAAAPDCAAQARDWVLLVQTGRATEAHLVRLRPVSYTHLTLPTKA